MISTKTIIGGIEDVPREWIFEYYLNLKERLTGQDVKILSAFNSSDKVPSMFIYFDTVNAQEVYSADALAYKNYIESEAYQVLLKKLRK